MISIHALREEGDLSPRPMNWPWQYFYPRPPRGGRRKEDARLFTPFRFLSTPSARRATHGEIIRAVFFANFYPRPPRGGRRYDMSNFAAAIKISIHALREEGDLSVVD